MRKLAVFFPGIGYHCDKPLLYYSRKIVQEQGHETVNLDYKYEAGNIRGNEAKMKEAFLALYAQAEKSLEDVSFSDFEEIIFISKSVGTIIASAYAHNYKIKCRHILYTPLKFTFEYKPQDALAFIGTDDPWSNVPEVIDIAKANNTPIRVYDGLNHSLECSDTLKNLDVLKQVMMETRDAVSN